MSTWEAIKRSKKAILWSLVISTCVIMEGYDTNLLGNFYAYPSFQKKYGNYVGVTSQTPSGYSLTAGWQSGLGQGGGCGSIMGTIINGWLVTAFGPKKVVLCTLGVMTCFLFIVFFAPNKPVLLVGEILLGFEWVSRLPPLQADEILIEHREFSPRLLQLMLRKSFPFSYVFTLHLVSLTNLIIIFRARTNRFRYQHVLHHWSTPFWRCIERPCQPYRSMGIPHSIRHPMGLALLPNPNHLLRTRVSMASSSTQQDR